MPEGRGNSSPESFLIRYNAPTKARGISIRGEETYERVQHDSERKLRKREVQQQEIGLQEKQLSRTLIAAGRERPRPVNLCPSEDSGHVRKKAVTPTIAR